MEWWSYALLALGFWGLWGFFSKVAANYLPGWIIFLAEIPAYLLIALVIWWLWQPALFWHRLGVGAAMLAGISGGLGLICFLQALAAKQAAVVVALTSLYPVLTALLSGLILQESLSWQKWLGIFLAVAAVALLAD